MFKQFQEKIFRKILKMTNSKKKYFWKILKISEQSFEEKQCKKILKILKQLFKENNENLKNDCKMYEKLKMFVKLIKEKHSTKILKMFEQC